MRKHGKEKRRTWRKLHLAIDTRTHEVIAAEMSMVNVADNEVLPTLLNPLRRKIAQVSADGAYDTKTAISCLSEKAVSPPFHRGKMRVTGRAVILEMRQLRR
jgi:hypothetical protein